MRKVKEKENIIIKNWNVETLCRILLLGFSEKKQI
jgi:hypothetical protein